MPTSENRQFRFSLRVPHATLIFFFFPLATLYSTVISWRGQQQNIPPFLMPYFPFQSRLEVISKSSWSTFELSPDTFPPFLYSALFYSSSCDTKVVGFAFQLCDLLFQLCGFYFLAVKISWFRDSQRATAISLPVTCPSLSPLWHLFHLLCIVVSVDSMTPLHIMKCVTVI